MKRSLAEIDGEIAEMRRRLADLRVERKASPEMRLRKRQQWKDRYDNDPAYHARYNERMRIYMREHYYRRKRDAHA